MYLQQRICAASTVWSGQAVSTKSEPALLEFESRRVKALRSRTRNLELYGVLRTSASSVSRQASSSCGACINVTTPVYSQRVSADYNRTVEFEVRSGLEFPLAYSICAFSHILLNSATTYTGVISDYSAHSPSKRNTVSTCGF